MNKKEFWIKDVVGSFIEPQNTKSLDIFITEFVLYKIYV